MRGDQVEQVAERRADLIGTGQHKQPDLVGGEGPEGRADRVGSLLCLLGKSTGRRR